MGNVYDALHKVGIKNAVTLKVDGHSLRSDPDDRDEDDFGEFVGILRNRDHVNETIELTLKRVVGEMVTVLRLQVFKRAAGVDIDLAIRQFPSQVFKLTAQHAAAFSDLCNQINTQLSGELNAIMEMVISKPQLKAPNVDQIAQAKEFAGQPQRQRPSRFDNYADMDLFFVEDFFYGWWYYDDPLSAFLYCQFYQEMFLMDFIDCVDTTGDAMAVEPDYFNDAEYQDAAAAAEEYTVEAEEFTPEADEAPAEVAEETAPGEDTGFGGDDYASSEPDRSSDCTSDCAPTDCSTDCTSDCACDCACDCGD
jgi:hypothetical protein